MPDWALASRTRYALARAVGNVPLVLIMILADDSLSIRHLWLALVVMPVGFLAGWA